MIYALITGILCTISYYIGIYRGMMKAKEIAKKLYREFGVFLPEEINNKNK